MRLIQESSLNDSVIFQTFNKQAEMMTTLNLCIKNGMILDSSYIQEQILQIKRTRISPLADHVLDSYEKGEIILIYSKVTRVPQAMPFVVLKVQGQMKAFVFVNNYGTISRDRQATGEEYLNMNMKDLYVLMEGAYTALSYYRYPVQITKNMGLMKLSNQIYTNMILRILNKEYALSLQQDLYNDISFCISKFFLSKIWENKNKDVINSYAMSAIVNPNKSNILITNDSYDNAQINTIEDLLVFIKTLSPRLDKLNMRYFTQCYLNTYKAGAIFSMECLPYFLYVVEATLIGSFLVNQPIISTILKNIKGMNTFYAELAKAL